MFSTPVAWNPAEATDEIGRLELMLIPKMPAEVADGVGMAEVVMLFLLLEDEAFGLESLDVEEALVVLICNVDEESSKVRMGSELHAEAPQVFGSTVKDRSS